MKATVFNPGAPIKKEDLDHNKFSIQDSLSDRLVDAFTPGVLYNSQENGEALPFEITSAGGLFINVGTGVAYASGLVDSSDTTETGGERIHIPVSDVGVGDNYLRSPGAGPGSGTGTGPFKESDDGLGSWYPTPQSTLTRLIPVVNAATNYIWIGYLHAIDPSVYSLHKATSGRIYPKGIDGYDIIVTQSASVPVFNGNANYSLIGTAVTAGGVVTVISQTGMVFAKTRPQRVGITINTATPPTTYSNGQTKFLDDHINAMGSGPGPTVENPHNQTLESFGVEFKDVDLIGHRDNHHSSGIIGTPASTTSSLYPRTDNATPVGGDLAMVFLKQLTPGEEAVISGLIFDEVTPKLIAPVGAGATGDAYLSFGAGTPAGNYAVFVKISGGVAVLDKRTPASIGSDEIYIATVDWNGIAFTGNGGVPNVTTDERLFGLTGSKDIQADSVGTSNIIDLSVTTAKIDSSAVTAAKMAANSVATASIQNLAVVEAALGNLSVSAAKLQTDAVETAKIKNLAVTEAKMADDAVESRALDTADGTSGQNTASGSGVKTDHIQDGAITLAKIDTAALSGSIAQVVYAETRTFFTINTVIPFDDTIPESTEGSDIIAVAITPKSATNVLLVEAEILSSSNRLRVSAIFKDSDTFALAASVDYDTATNTRTSQTRTTHRMLAGTTSAITFKVKMGNDLADAIQINGYDGTGTRIFGGAAVSWIKVTEIRP